METNTARTLRPIIDDAPIDCLDTFEAVEVLGRNLRPGMMILDELDTVCIVLDHKVPATRNSGCVAFLAENIDPSTRHAAGNRWSRHELHRNATFRVAAR